MRRTADGSWLRARLAEHTRRDEASGCYVWQLRPDAKGYGRIKLLGKYRRAHRVAYEAAHGAIPAGLLVLHRCDNRRCCNPDHLFLGTNRDNFADMQSKGRARGRAVQKLTDEIVLALRRRVAEGGAFSRQDEAERLGVDPKTLRLAINGGTFKHLNQQQEIG